MLDGAGVKKRGGRVWARLARLGMLAVAAGLLAAGAIVAAGLHDDIAPSDVGIVLGAKVERDGRPSIMLAARLDKALQLYRRRLFPLVIVSGGQGREGFDEAQVMRAYLMARGVPHAAILVDSRGVRTLATARNAAALMRARGLRSALVVTQYFHVPRSRLALAKAGVRTIHSAHADLFDVRDFYSVPREVVGYAVYLVR